MVSCTPTYRVVIGVALTVGAFVPLPAADPPKGEGPAYRVKSVGEMRNVMQKGDLASHVDCTTLRETKALYALGPVEGLKGEITIIDGKPSVATVVDGKPAVGEEWPKACFLVYAQVERWATSEVAKDVESLEQLEPIVHAAAKKAGVDVEKPFPFLLTGTPKLVRYHIVWKTDGLPHTKELHAKAKLPFEIKEREVKMVGFYSDKHHGVFTHHDSNIHVHVRTTDGKDSGHVDAVALPAGMTLHLPKP